MKTAKFMKNIKEQVSEKEYTFYKGVVKKLLSYLIPLSTLMMAIFFTVILIFDKIIDKYLDGFGEMILSIEMAWMVFILFYFSINEIFKRGSKFRRFITRRTFHYAMDELKNDEELLKTIKENGVYRFS